MTRRKFVGEGRQAGEQAGEQAGRRAETDGRRARRNN